MTLEDIAQAIGVARSTVQRYEADAITKPKLPVVQGIAKVLGVNANWLLGKTDDSTPTDIGFDDFTYALYGEAKDLTEENKAKLLEMARFFKEHQ